MKSDTEGPVQTWSSLGVGSCLAVSSMNDPEASLPGSTTELHGVSPFFATGVTRIFRPRPSKQASDSERFGQVAESRTLIVHIKLQILAAVLNASCSTYGLFLTPGSTQSTLNPHADVNLWSRIGTAESAKRDKTQTFTPCCDEDRHEGLRP